MGEYLNNQMDGKGVYVWSNGTYVRMLPAPQQAMPFTTSEALFS